MQFFRDKFASSPRTKASRRRSSSKLAMEHLEDRTAPAVLTFTAEADAYVQQAKPSSTGGTSTNLYVEGSPVTDGLVRFGVTGISGGVQSAKLRLYVLDGSVDGPAVYATGTSWVENSVNWGTKPARTSGILDDRGAVSPGSWMEYEVKAVVTGNGTYSFDLATTSTDSVKLSSRQGTQPPQLVITTGSTTTSMTASAGPDRSGNEGGSVSFAGTTSGGTAPYTYQWNFGDGTTASGSLTPGHVYADNGTYTALLTVTDVGGRTIQDTASVTIANNVPVVSAGADIAIATGATFSRSGSFTDSGIDSWTATVNYGDGTGTQTLALNSNKTYNLSHPYTTAGNYTVTVSVRDDDNGVGTDTLLVTVGSAPTKPTVTISATDASASEGGSDTGRFTVTRSGSTSAALTVTYSVGGSASNGSDYSSLSGNLTIPAGATSAAITITPVDDSVVESSESVAVTLSSASGYSLGSPSSATVTIADNDTPTGSRVFYVSTSGSDSSNGSLSTPWRTINSAVSKLKAGDTLYVRGGTYYERATFGVSGTASAPITIQAYPGEKPVLDSGVQNFRNVGNSDWVVDNASLGIYRSVKTYSSLGTLYGYVTNVPGYINGIVGLVPYKNEAMFRATTDQYVNSSQPFYVGPGAYFDSDGHIYIRLAKTADMRTVEARDGQVFSSDLPDPRNYSIVISGVSTTVNVTGAYLKFDGLEVHQATRAIQVQSSAHDLVFRNMTVWCGDGGIEVYGGHHILIEQSRVYGDVPRWIAWSDSKSSPAPADAMRGTNINLFDGAHDIEVRYTHIRGGHDLFGMNDNEYNISVHHSRLENAQDDAFEIEGTTNVGRHDIYENYIGNCLMALSEGQDTKQFDGPGFFYRNVVVLLHNPFINRKDGINGWNGGGRYGFEYMFKQAGSGYATKNVHIYQNTLVMLNTAGDGIQLMPQNPTNARIANNLVIMVNGQVDDYSTASGLVRDGNLYWKMNTVDAQHLLAGYDTVAAFAAATGQETHGVGSTSKRGTDPRFATFQLNVLDKSKTVWQLSPSSEIFDPADFLVSSGSPAIGAGIVIPSLPGFGTLPDSRNSRDIGAIPYGTSASQYNVFPFNITSGSLEAAPGAAPRGTAQTVTASEIAPLLEEAITRWQRTGLSAEQVAALRNVQVQVTDLGGKQLGRTAGNTVWLDDNAAGWGWFVDATPRDDSEFKTPGNQGEKNRMDLLTALMHELGHVLSKDHETSGVMAEALALGTRRSPTFGARALTGVDHYFSSLDLSL